MGSKKVTIGYRYYLGVQIVLAKTADAIRRIFVDEREAWRGTVVANQTIIIDKENLFGGEGTGGQGGVQGLVDIEFGEPDQTPNAYVEGQVGSDIPAYRGKVSMTFRGPEGGRAFYWAAFNPYIKPVAVEMTRIESGWGRQEITEEIQYSNYVLYPWDTDGADPRSCLNDHEYSWNGGAWGTEEEAKAAAAVELGVSSVGTLHGWSKGNASDGSTEVHPHVSGVTPGESEILFLHYNNYVPVGGYFGSLPNPAGNPLTGYAQSPYYRGVAVYNEVGASGDDIWWNGVTTPSPDHDLIEPNGTFQNTNQRRLGVYRLGPYTFTPTWVDRIREIFEDNIADIPSPGNQIYSSAVSLDTLIAVRRKIRAPDEPCFPKCDDAYPDYELDSSYCVIEDAAVKKDPWVLEEGDFKVLTTYGTSGGNVARYPLNAAVPAGDPGYDDEAFWVGQRNAAILAGYAVPSTYSDTGLDDAATHYPVKVDAAFVRNAGTIIEGSVWYPECVAIYRPGNLIRTEYVNLDAITNASSTAGGAAAVGVTISDVDPTSVLRITANTDGPYVAWSPWGEPALDGDQTGSVYLFRVIEDGVLGSAANYGLSGPYDGYEMARVAFQEIEPVELTGASEYLFSIPDSPILDNTGGVSLRVDITEPAIPDMNPAHIIYQALTEPDFGIGLPTEFIDSPSFEAAADQLCAEEFGLSFIWLRQEPVEDFINIILDHINAALYQDRTDGKFRLKLIRDDYDPDDLETFDESNLVEVDTFSRVGWGETVNEVVVGYTNPENEKEATVSVQNLANIQLQGGVVSSKRSYAGIRTANLAYRVAQRDLKIGSTPLAACKITANRSAWNVPPGGVFKLSWADYDIASVIFRVTGIDYGSVTDRTITIDCVEDVFGLPDSSYAEEQPPLWVNPAQPPTDIGEFKITEASYHELFNQVTESEIDVLEGNETFIVAMAQKGVGANTGFDTWTAAADEDDSAILYGTSTITPSAVLGADIAQLTTSLSYMTQAGGVLTELVPGYADIDDERIWIESIDPETETMVVRRGIQDTVPVSHSAGAIIWFWNGQSGENGVLNFVGGHVEDEEVFIFLPGRSSIGTQTLSATSDTSYTGVARWNTPWPPADVKINDSYFPSLVEDDLTISWVGRNKLQQTTEGDAGAIGWTEGNIDPEVGATYTLLLKDGETDVLLDTFDGLVLGDSPYTVLDPISYGSSILKIEFFSVLDGRESYQRFVHTVNLAGLRETEDGDVRETEDGDERETEF